MPGSSHGAGQQSVSLVVVEELFGFWVPAELSAQADGDVVQVADRIGADGGVHWADCFLPGLDAVQKVAAVVAASRQANLIRADGGGQEGLRLGVDKLALD